MAGTHGIAARQTTETAEEKRSTRAAPKAEAAGPESAAERDDHGGARNVRHLDPAPAVFDAMQEGWARQQSARLPRSSTIDPRLCLIERPEEKRAPGRR